VPSNVVNGHVSTWAAAGTGTCAWLARLNLCNLLIKTTLQESDAYTDQWGSCRNYGEMKPTCNMWFSVVTSANTCVWWPSDAFNISSSFNTKSFNISTFFSQLPSDVTACDNSERRFVTVSTSAPCLRRFDLNINQYVTTELQYSAHATCNNNSYGNTTTTTTNNNN